MFVAMCSPSRHPDADYQAYGHSSVVDPLGNVVAEADEKEATIYVDIGGWGDTAPLTPDPEMLATTRRNLPVTVQRRFDVYPDVAAGLK